MCDNWKKALSFGLTYDAVLPFKQLQAIKQAFIQKKEIFEIYSYNSDINYKY